MKKGRFIVVEEDNKINPLDFAKTDLAISCRDGHPKILKDRWNLFSDENQKADLPKPFKAKDIELILKDNLIDRFVKENTRLFEMFAEDAGKGGMLAIIGPRFIQGDFRMSQVEYVLKRLGYRVDKHREEPNGLVVCWCKI